MGIVLGDNSYGKAEVRLVRLTRGEDRHELRDLTVGTTLAGELTATHLTGDNRDVVPTDTQKNTVYAFAGDGPVGEIEEFGLRLARHFVAGFPQIRRARVEIEEHGWLRITVEGRPHPHAFVRAGEERRVTTVSCTPDTTRVVSGLRGLIALKSTGSQFRGFATDRYTTLAETDDRILATAVDARWRFAGLDVDWATSHAQTRRLLVETFATTYSRSLQQTLYAMGRAVLENRPEIVEVRLSLPNRHHLPVDLTPFGVADGSSVFQPTDRPYGLIEGTVRREDAPEPEAVW